MSIRTDGAYALTRRRGESATVTRLTGFSADPETGNKTPVEATTTVRWMFKQPTQSYILYRAEQTQTQVGDTTFIMWLRDVKADFTKLTKQDKITYGGVDYQPITSVVEDQGLVVTARTFD